VIPFHLVNVAHQSTIMSANEFYSSGEKGTYQGNQRNQQSQYQGQDQDQDGERGLLAVCVKL